jgi:hypothetical protein
MREFVELQDLSDHACGNPCIERLEVYEPIGMQAVWLTIFRCCSQIFSEPTARIEKPRVWGPLRVQGEAA